MKNRHGSRWCREFVFIVIVILSGVPLIVRAADRNSLQPFDISPRQESSFSTGWVFLRQNRPGIEKPDFDDADFEHVSVPHANIMVPHETFDPDTFRFVSWYRKHFMAKRHWEGKTVEVEFQGVMTVADVYLNGRLLGHHAGGYTPFTVNLTPALNFDAENILAIRVDSTEQRQVPPEGAEKMSGYYLFGGIQRDVTMRVFNSLHIRDVYHTTPQVQPTARLETRINLTNGRPEAFDGILTVHILDAAGAEVISAETPVKLTAGEKHEFQVNLDQIRNVKPWDVDHPTRYVALVEVRGPNGPVDRVRTWLGFRTIRWDEGSGQFSLNGTPIKLRGMNRHQTFAYVGGGLPIGYNAVMPVYSSMS
jgi:beta-galactosidase